MIGVVGSIVPLTILAAVVYFYMRNRRRKDAQQRQSQMLSPDGMDAYKQRTSSKYGLPPINTVPFAPYVSFSRDTGLGHYLDFFLPRILPIHRRSLLKVWEIR